jgi:hypothetical protein
MAPKTQDRLTRLTLTVKGSAHVAELETTDLRHIQAALKLRRAHPGVAG